MNSPQQLQPPIVFKVSKPVCAGKFPDGNVYVTPARATALRERRKPMRMGISYFDGRGDFFRYSIDPYDGWL